MENNYAFETLEKIENVYQKNLKEIPSDKLFGLIGSSKSILALFMTSDELKSDYPSLTPAEVAGCRKLYQDHIRGKAPKPEDY